MNSEGIVVERAWRFFPWLRSLTLYIAIGNDVTQTLGAVQASAEQTVERAQGKLARSISAEYPRRLQAGRHRH